MTVWAQHSSMSLWSLSLKRLARPRVRFSCWCCAVSDLASSKALVSTCVGYVTHCCGHDGRHSTRYRPDSVGGHLESRNSTPIKPFVRIFIYTVSFALHLLLCASAAKRQADLSSFWLQNDTASYTIIQYHPIYLTKFELLRLFKLELQAFCISAIVLSKTSKYWRRGSITHSCQSCHVELILEIQHVHL